ncbi:MAG: acetyltransferase [Chthonomonadales bacterium]
MTTGIVKVVVIGAGGHARAVIDAIQASGKATAFAVVCDDGNMWGENIFGVPIVGNDEMLCQLENEGATHFVNAVGSLNNWRVRESIYKTGLASGLKPWTVIHPSAVISDHAIIGSGCQIMPGAHIIAGAVVGSNVLLNTRSVVEHDCCVDDHAFLATGAVLSGGVKVGEGALIGSGASVRQGITIGCGATVGVGSAVVKDVAPGETVVGNPAIPIRKHQA